MTKKNIPGIAIIRITITVILMILAIFANFIAIRRMARYATEVYFYDKLSVAYDIGGINGLKSELAKIKTRDKLRYELAMAAEFQKRLESLRNPEDFIDNALSEAKERIALLKNLRSYAIALILAILTLRILLNLRFVKIKK